MNEEITNKVVPKLRFPEFMDSGEWEEKKLEEIANVIASGDLDSNSFSSVPTEEHLYPIYSNSISEKGLYGYNTYSKYKRNSITITARGTLGVAFVRDTEFVGIGRLLIISDLTNVNSIFFKENWNNYAIIPIENGGIPQLTAVKAKSVVLLYPKLQEQQKIADCLSSLDDLISAQKQKLEALKTHKKGLMQQLFPAEGETVPKLQFAEFRDSGNWEEATLDDVATFLKGKGISKADVDTKGNLPCIRYGELYTHYKEIIKSTISFTSLPAEDLVLSEMNDVIIPSSGETQEDIATAACVIKSGIALGGDLNIIRSVWS